MRDKNTWYLSIIALGVVFGDIGTSPLYTMPVALHGVLVNKQNVFGVLSIIFWLLIVVISTRYLTLYLRADNHGEGGVLALLALMKRKNNSIYQKFFWLGILGAGLLLGDGMITPAISVMAAIEGLKVITPNFSYVVLPLTIAILLILFFLQRFGTGDIGKLFGPIILIWFLVIGILGIYRIWHYPHVIEAINPIYIFQFFKFNGWHAFLLLGGVFLVVTGAEALYADMGHFGKNPIRIGWFTIALPCLLLNYFGQGAFVIQNPEALNNLFYLMSPSWFSIPLLIIATVATSIASQAIIAASFSLTKQAILLNLFPRFSVIQTSKMSGQVYVPRVNMMLAAGAIFLVAFFKSSSALAGAYGLAVNLVMIIVGALIILVARVYWQWSITKIFLTFISFVMLDLLFLASNFTKIWHGGWIPVMVAIICSIVMITWRVGIRWLRTSYFMNRVNLKKVISDFNQAELYYLPNSAAVFITDPYDQSGGSFLHFLRRVAVLPAIVLIVSVHVTEYPRILKQQRFELEKISKQIYRLKITLGFMQHIDVPQSLKAAIEAKIIPFHIDLEKLIYLIESIEINVTDKKKSGMWNWQKLLFSFLMHNSMLNFKFFRLPHHRTIILGTVCNL